MTLQSLIWTKTLWLEKNSLKCKKPPFSKMSQMNINKPTDMIKKIITQTLLILKCYVWDFIDKFTKFKKMITWKFQFINQVAKLMILKLTLLLTRSSNFCFFRLLSNYSWSHHSVRSFFFTKDNKCSESKKFLMIVVNNLLRLFKK